MGMFSPDENGWVPEEELKAVENLLKKTINRYGKKEVREKLTKSNGVTINELKLYDKIFPRKKKKPRKTGLQMPKLPVVVKDKR